MRNTLPHQPPGQVMSEINKSLKLTWLFLSIREFCDLKIPILMFDKDEKYCVLRLEDVSRCPDCHSRGLLLLTEHACE